MARHEAIWQEGAPVNLPATALDALEWLVWLRDRMQHRPFVDARFDEARARLARAVAALETYTAQYTPVDRQAPTACRAEVVASSQIRGEEEG